MSTAADQLVAPAALTNGQQSVVVATSNGQKEPKEPQQQIENIKSTSPKPGAMPSLKLNKMPSASSKEKRVYKIVLTGGKFFFPPFKKVSDNRAICVSITSVSLVSVVGYPPLPLSHSPPASDSDLCSGFVSRSRAESRRGRDF